MPFLLLKDVVSDLHRSISSSSSSLTVEPSLSRPLSRPTAQSPDGPGSFDNVATTIEAPVSASAGQISSSTTTEGLLGAAQQLEDTNVSAKDTFDLDAITTALQKLSHEVEGIIAMLSELYDGLMSVTQFLGMAGIGDEAE